MADVQQSELGDCTAALEILGKLRAELTELIRVFSELDRRVGPGKLSIPVKKLEDVRDKLVKVDQPGERWTRLEAICALISDDFYGTSKEFRDTLDRMWNNLSGLTLMPSEPSAEIKELREHLEELAKLRDFVSGTKKLKLGSLMQQPAMEKLDKAIALVSKFQNLSANDPASLEELLELIKKYGLQVPPEFETNIEKAVTNLELYKDFLGTLERIRDLSEILQEQVNAAAFRELGIKLRALRELHNDLAKVSDVQNLAADVQLTEV